MAENTTETHQSEITRFWRHLFGSLPGLLQVWTVDPDETIKSNFFNYPAAAESAATYALEKTREEGREVYYSAHLFTEARRIKGNASEVLALWADMDGAPIPNGNLKPTALVESSPGRFHCSWRLTDSIPPEIAEELNKRIALATGADPSGFDLTQLLRVPGTTNYKYPEHPTVQLRSLDGKRSYIPAELDEILPKLEENQRNGHHAPPVGEKIREGARNEQLISLAGTMRRRGMEEEEIAAALLVTNKRRCDPPLPEREVLTIAASAIRYNPESTAGGKPEKPAPPTHDELRDRYLTRDLAHGVGSWRTYKDGIFKETSESTIKAGILKAIEEAKPEGIKPTNALLTSVTELTRVKATIPDELWNADPDILALENGTLHIPTRELRPHARENYLTSSLPYGFEPDAKALTWEVFLRETLPSEVAKFLQEFAGFTLTTDTSHELAVWLYGPPGGGKSTFISGLETMLGHRAGVLGLAELERSRFALGNIEGKTLLTATEQPSQYLATTHLLNALISGEPMMIEQKYRDAYQLTPKSKLLWALNELPRISDANNGLFRRVRIIEFPEVPPEKRDPLYKTFIRDEGAGILNWALDGLQRLQQRGHFDIPSTVQDASDRFKETNDVPAIFVEEMCVRDPNDRVQTSRLYREYKFWCEENGHRPLSSTRMATEWERLGFEKLRSNGVRYYSGVRLRLPSE